MQRSFLKFETFVLLMVVLGQLSCTHISRVPASEDPKKEDSNLVSAVVRLEAIKKAAIVEMHPTPVGDVDIISGPEQNAKHKNNFQFNDRVYCRYKGTMPNGKTPKFKCVVEKIERDVLKSNGSKYTEYVTVEPNDEVKVKFRPNGKDNKEIYAEAAATRLFWALGFFADTIYPVQLICLDCPQDPTQKANDMNPIMSEHNWGPATIERKYPGEEIQEKEDQGWSWLEFANLNQNSRATKDALALLAAFVAHGDNKASQQRLVCSDSDINIAKKEKINGCNEPKMFIQDLGATFGGAGKTTNGNTAKMNLSHWLNKPEETIWAKAEKCKARLGKSMAADDGLSDPVISEEGRRYLAERMCQLSRKQIEDIFKVSRVERSIENDPESKSIKKWVEAFLLKRNQIVSNQNCVPAVGPKPKVKFDAQTCEELYLQAHPNGN